MKLRVSQQILLGFMFLLVAVTLSACSGDKGTKSPDTDNNSSANGESLSDSQSEGNEDTVGATAGDVVTVGMTQDLVSLDPHQITDAGTRNVVFNLYEGLVKPTSDGDLKPAVASSYTISEDGTVYEFILRDGIQFHDGSLVTVEDIKYSIERYAEIQGGTSAFSILEEVVIVDEQTVQIKLTEGNTEFLADLVIAILPESNDDPEGNPIGTGPFKYVSYTPGQKVTFEKNEYYWQDGKPHLEEVEFKIIADVETAFIELQAGTIDILNYLTIDQVEILGDEFNIVEGSMNLVQALYLNNDYEPLQDIRVRQALCYAVDRQAVNEFLFGGKSQLIGSHMVPSISKYYEASAADMYSYNPDKAKELLAEAGYGGGFDLVISVPSAYSQHVTTAEIIVENLTAVGINASIQQIEWSSWLSDVYAGRDYQATVVGVDGTLAPRDWFAKYESTASNNFMNYRSEAFDELFKQAVATVNDDEKVSLYKQLQVILAEDAANVYIEDPADFVAVSSRLAGYEFYPTAAQDMSTVYFID